MNRNKYVYAWACVKDGKLVTFDRHDEAKVRSVLARVHDRLLRKEVISMDAFCEICEMFDIQVRREVRAA